MATAYTRTPLTTLTVRNDASVASVSLKRFDNGDLEFTAKNGRRVVAPASNVALSKLFDAIAALV